MTDNQKYTVRLADAYQPLFNLMHNHGLILLKDEMDEIIETSISVKEIADAIMPNTYSPKP